MREDTICAVATAPGSAGISILRLSGSKAKEVAQRVFHTRKELRPRYAALGKVMDGSALVDQALGIYFPAPASYTGEDVFEIHCHGGQMATQLTLDLLLQNGARPAEPGEFTKRAFLNGKLDLSEAEAVAEHIGSLSEEGAKRAARQMEGELSRAVRAMQDALSDILAEMEAGIEYPEEDLEQEISGAALPRLREIREQAARLAGSFRQGRLVREGIEVALCGRPNVGKSSLLNAIFGEERAIVSDVPGTTRDIISAHYSYRGLSLRFLDTAGLRQTDDTVEKIGVQRSRQAIDQAAIAVVLVDGSAPLGQEDMRALSLADGSGANVIAVLNKQDLPSQEGVFRQVQQLFGAEPLRVSAKTGEGLERLLEEIYQKALGSAQLYEGTLITNARHAHALRQAEAALGEAICALEREEDLDCVTIDLNGAWMHLGEITGQTVSEEIIDRIFSKFCLGK